MRDPNADYSTSDSGVNLSDAQPERRRSGDIDFANLIEPVARLLLGEPTSSTKDELRFGAKGSLSVDLKKGVWKSFETDEGGGCLALIRRERSGDPIKWLREQRLIRDKTIVATFDYPDEQTTVLYQTYRQATGDIKVRRPDGRGGWIYNIDGVRRVLYRLPELLASTGVVYITEGEKHADRLRALGLTATCNVFGAGSARSKKWRPEYNEFLRDRDVVILPDNDDIGREHARKIARNLTRVAKRVRVLMLPGLKPKGDILNWLEAGGTVEELARLTEECATWEETEPGSPEDGGNYERQYEPYYIQNGCIYWDKPTAHGSPIPVRLTNFTAQIIADVKLDDGSGLTNRQYTIEGSLGQAEVPVEKFNTLMWVERWGRRAIINPGNNHDRHIANAIKTLSPDAIDKTVYTHLGWREIKGQLVFLHAGGAIGANGPVDGIEVNPGNSTLDKFILPPVTDLRAAMCCSLSLLEVAPAKIVYPLWGAIYRAPLSMWSPMTVTVWMLGPTGVQKTSLANIAQAHFAPGISNVANWSSTANANERLAFLAKDVLLLVDDFAPRGTQSDVARLHNTAERNVRAQANQGGRLRMNADATLKEAMYPRGGLLVTGEDLARGESLRARAMVLEMMKGDVVLAQLTALQDCAAYGLPAEAISGYVSSLARQPDHEWISAREKVLRAEATGDHARTKENVACLMVGIESGLQFAVEIGALDEREAEHHRALAWKTLNELAAVQATYLRSESPADRFVVLLQSILSSGRAHVANMSGEAPLLYRDALGWREGGMLERDVPVMLNGAEVIDAANGLPRMRRVNVPYYRSQGRQIGWVDEQFIYLIPDATYAEIQEHARVQNAPMGETQPTLWKALDAANLLAQKDAERRTTQKRILGQRPHVLCLHLRTVLDDDDPAELPF